MIAVIAVQKQTATKNTSSLINDSKGILYKQWRPSRRQPPQTKQATIPLPDSNREEKWDNEMTQDWISSESKMFTGHLLMQNIYIWNINDLVNLSSFSGNKKMVVLLFMKVQRCSSYNHKENIFSEDDNTLMHAIFHIYSFWHFNCFFLFWRFLKTNKQTKNNLNINGTDEQLKPDSNI